MEEFYQTNGEPQPRPRGVGPRRVIDAAKDNVKVIDLADLLCGPGNLRKVGDRWIGRCPLPDHEDRTPSFVAYVETNSWYCFGCARGGDVVHLAQFAWNHDRPAMAAADLLLEFGHEIPERPVSWYRKQRRQKPVRDAIARRQLALTQRRIYRVWFAPQVAAIEDDEVRAQEIKTCWDDCYWLAEMFESMRRGRS